MSAALPDSKGNLADVVLGKGTISEYVNDTSYFGPVTGRVAQRISRGRFVLDGKVYHLYRNDGNNTIHGGGRGFSKSIWTVKEYVGTGDSPVHYFVLPWLRWRARFSGGRGRVRDVPAVEPVRAGRAHERDGAGQGDAGELPAARVLELGRPRQRRRPGPHAPALRVSAHRTIRGAPPVVGPRRARGRHAPRLPDPNAHRSAHPAGHGRPYRRVRRQLRHRRGGHAAGGGCPGRRLRQGAGAVGEPANDAAVHGQLAEQHQGEGRQGVQPVRRVLSGDDGIRRRGEPPRVPVANTQAWSGVQARYGLQIRVLARCMTGVLHKQVSTVMYWCSEGQIRSSEPLIGLEQTTEDEMKLRQVKILRFFYETEETRNPY